MCVRREKRPWAPCRKVVCVCMGDRAAQGFTGQEAWLQAKGAVVMQEKASSASRRGLSVGTHSRSEGANRKETRCDYEVCQCVYL